MIYKLFSMSLILLFPVVSNAADAQTWSGAWALADKPDADNAREKAIEQATDDLSVFKRGTARSRIGKMLAPPKKLILKPEGGQVKITRDGKTMTLTLDGKPQTVDTDRGSVSARAESTGESLVVIIDGAKGKRKTVYSHSGSTLTMSVELNAKLLSTPVKVSSTYKAK